MVNAFQSTLLFVKISADGIFWSHTLTKNEKKAQKCRHPLKPLDILSSERRRKKNYLNYVSC